MRSPLLILLIWSLMTKGLIFTGTMVVRPESPFVIENMQVTVDEANSHGETTIHLHKVKFSKMMPVRLNIDIPHVKVTRNGSIQSFQGNDIVPQKGGKPYHSRIVKNLTGTLDRNRLKLALTIGDAPIRYDGLLNSKHNQ